MENASNALIMAAGILIGIMILSLGVALVNIFGSTAAEVQEQVRQNQISFFNSQFTKYDGTEVTIYEILTVGNLAVQNNIEELNYPGGAITENTLYVEVIAKTATNVDLKASNAHKINGQNVYNPFMEFRK